MEKYKPRTIQFREIERIEEWQIKVYTISKEGNFKNEDFYKNVINMLPRWLKQENGFDNTNDKIGFLILHSGTEGIFSLINWWVGKNMLNTQIFLTLYNDVHQFKKISGQGLAPCVWELEVINHERISWTNNILKTAKPQYLNYLKDVINKQL
ncbi:MAG: hypothetical protein ABJJ05_11330 [Maribacter litoralis]|uniref:hypothetical protein n=1 Tax=Maribacter litoralis TaxID=2059726 RepID=UPI0032979549